MSKMNVLILKPLGINTYKEAVVYMRSDCHVCRAEGFEAPARVKVIHKNGTILATLNTINSELLTTNEASLSNFAWENLKAQPGDEVRVHHPDHLHSLEHIRDKIDGHELNKEEINEIIQDVVDGSLSDIHISAFLAASGKGRFTNTEILHLTEAMINVGNRLTWTNNLVVDKHCIGGLPGNRTSIIIVPIVAAYGLTIPKTSSRSITSPAGTADTMEVMTPVSLDISNMRKVVEKENGCLIWGGSVNLSPADDILIRIERALTLDSMGQLVASILSKKIAAGSSHVIIDIPIGPTVKVATMEAAKELELSLKLIAKSFDIEVQTIFTDGSAPVGKGIGPALEAKDVLAVLRNDPLAPPDLKERALVLAGRVIEFSSTVQKGTGYQIASELLFNGKAWNKFEAICNAQGGLFEPPTAKFQKTIRSSKKGKIISINNTNLARLAKLAGAPQSKAAGVELITTLGSFVEIGDPLFIIYSQTKGELNYAYNFLSTGHEVFAIGEQS